MPGSKVSNFCNIILVDFHRNPRSVYFVWALSLKWRPGRYSKTGELAQVLGDWKRSKYAEVKQVLVSARSPQAGEKGKMWG